MDANKALNQINAGSLLTIDVPYELVVNKKEYKGMITYRFPSVRDEISIGLEEAKLRGTLVEIAGRPELITVAYSSLDAFTQYIITGLATLKVLAIQTSIRLEDRIDFDKLPQEVLVEIHRGYLRQKDGEGTEPTEPDTNNTGTEPIETTEQGGENPSS